ncbi:MAG TPA: fumarate hydratase C-terminal domain-containing protein [bacterium]|nr:fumarate hydratase C-terminal domain-containing protein [bacterium]HPJ72015.1 fumarate hydratase C-terminal domain-containing protein [bacterium]HPQ67263.1 fumarate hydratase C-terminal domain-containing protein [bacterium]
MKEATSRRETPAVRMTAPPPPGRLEAVRAGTMVEITGILYSARDRALERLFAGEEPFPFDPRGQLIYFAGPTPGRPGRPVGAMGPTSSSRMGKYISFLLERGVRGIIGKGRLCPEGNRALRQGRGVYFLAVGGAGALLGRRVREAEPVAGRDLGPEAVHRLAVEKFPVIVAVDAEGNSLFKSVHAGGTRK